MEEEKSFKLMLQQSVILYKGKPYCYVCSVSVESWKDIISHVQSQNHVSLMNNCICLSYSELANFSENECEKWVKNGIVLDKTKQLKCTLCTCFLSNFNCIHKHINSKHHRKAQKIKNLKSNQKYYQKYHQILIENELKVNWLPCMICTICLARLPTLNELLPHIEGNHHNKMIQTLNLEENAVNTESTKYNTHNNNYSVEENVDMDISKSEMKDLVHIHEKHRIVQGKIDNVACNICSCPIMTFENALQHINGKRHRKALKRIMSVQKVGDSAATESINTDCVYNDFLDHIEKVESFHKVGIIVGDHHTIICTICFCLLPSLNSIVEHVEGKRHTNKIKSLGKSNVLSVIYSYADTKCDESNLKLAKKDVNLRKGRRKSVVECSSSTSNVQQDNPHLLEHNRILNNVDGLRCLCCNLVMHYQKSWLEHLCKTEHIETIKRLLNNIERGCIERNKGSTLSKTSNYMGYETFPICTLILKNSNAKDTDNEELMFINMKVNWKYTNESFANNRIIDVVYICRICYIELESLQNLAEHLSDRRHMASVEGKDFIKMQKQPASEQYQELNDLFHMISINDAKKEKEEMEEELPIANNINSSKNNSVKKPLTSTSIDGDECTEEEAITPKYIEIEHKVHDFSILEHANILEVGGNNHCIICNQNIFKDMQQLSFHARYCNIKKVTKDKRELVSNFIKEIGNESYIKCLLCEMEVINVEQHIKCFSHKLFANKPLMEIEDKKYECLVCEMVIMNVEHHILTDFHKENTKNPIRKIEETLYKCYVCGKAIIDTKSHILSDLHKQNVANAKNNLLKLTLQMKDYMNRWFWYSTDRFWCDICSWPFTCKGKFIGHIIKKHNSSQHIFEGCMTCSILWLSATPKALSHSTHSIHKYLESSKLFHVTELPHSTIELFHDINTVVDELYQLSENVLLPASIQSRLKVSVLEAMKHVTSNIDTKVTLFGPRITGLTFSETNVNISLDLAVRDGQLHSACKEWDVIATGSTRTFRDHQMYHRQTQLLCDISYRNISSVKKWKILGFYTEQYEPCRKLILFLQKWLLCCTLPGRYNISEEALIWLVIFSLQVNLQLPSVASHAAGKPHCKGMIKTTDESETIRHLLVEFFTLYSDFDYQHYVICPFMGKKISKTSFTRLEKLPSEMSNYYEAHLKNYNNRFLYAGNSMCVQDPIHLHSNLTKDIQSVTLKFFREYCKKSLKALSDVKA